MEYELLKEIDAHYLIEYLNDLNNTAIKWNQRLAKLHDEYEELKDLAYEEYQIQNKIDEFNDSSKSYYYEMINKIQRTRLEITSIYEYIVKDKMFLEMISDRELMTYFRELGDISEELESNVNKNKKLSIKNKDVKEYNKGYDYNLLDIDENFYENYDDNFDSLYLEDAKTSCKQIDKDLKKTAKATLTLKHMIKNHTITYR